jgi:hypothetical protein
MPLPRNTADFKSKVALEALRERQPIHEISKRYQVHASQVTECKQSTASIWRSQLIAVVVCLMSYSYLVAGWGVIASGD